MSDGRAVPVTYDPSTGAYLTEDGHQVIIQNDDDTEQESQQQQQQQQVNLGGSFILKLDMYFFYILRISQMTVPSPGFFGPQSGVGLNGLK